MKVTQTSRSTIGEVEYEAIAGRDLSEFQEPHFFIDGVAERLHAGMRRARRVLPRGS